MGKRTIEDVQKNDDIVNVKESDSASEIHKDEKDVTTIEDDSLLKPEIDKTTKDLHGSCACGNVKLVVPKGATIIFSGFCHCASCRKMSACPILSCFGIPTSAAPDFPTDKETDVLGFTQITEGGPERFFCKKCSVYMYSHWSGYGGSTLGIHHGPFDAFEEIPPRNHVNYGEKVMTIKDGLPKYKTYPPMAPGMPFELMEE